MAWGKWESSTLYVKWGGVLAYLMAVPSLLLVAAVAQMLGDRSRAAAEVKESLAGKAVMVCEAGVIDYGEPGLYGRLFTTGHFRCTEWRMRG